MKTNRRIVIISLTLVLVLTAGLFWRTTDSIPLPAQVQSVSKSISTPPKIDVGISGKVVKASKLETSSRNLYPFTDTPLGRKLHRHLTLMWTRGEDAEKKYQASLRELNDQAPEVSNALLTAYRKLAETDYDLRFSVAHTLGKIYSDHALSALSEIALAPLAPERSDDPENSSRPKESAVFSAATEGIGALSVYGNREAESTLKKLMDHPLIGVKRIAVETYLGSGKDREARIEYVKSQLPKAEHYLIEQPVTPIATARINLSAEERQQLGLQTNTNPTTSPVDDQTSGENSNEI